jgi:hypothetical protein
MDDKFADGPTFQRHCTDCFCCLLFVAFLLGMIYCSIAGYENENYKLLLAPYDSAGIYHHTNSFNLFKENHADLMPEKITHTSTFLSWYWTLQQQVFLPSLI